MCALVSGRDGAEGMTAGDGSATLRNAMTFLSAAMTTKARKRRARIAETTRWSIRARLTG
jgi:hypothetical protein